MVDKKNRPNIYEAETREELEAAVRALPDPLNIIMAHEIGGLRVKVKE